MLKKSFKIDSDIYKDESINIAIEDFRDVSIIKYSEHTLHISSDTDENIDNIFNEFMNYVTWVQNELIN